MIKLQNLNKSYKTRRGEVQVLKNINLYIKEGELCLLQGRSGSGKTTLLHIIASLIKPSSGSVEVMGENIAKYSDYHASLYRRDTLAYITQNFYLFEELSVYENLLPPLLIKNLKQKKFKQRILSALQSANILHKEQESVVALSKGEKQRVIIARALVNKQKIILCDEPTANLDKENALAFLELLQTLKQEGYTLLIATHDTIFDTIHADKRFYIEEGSLE